MTPEELARVKQFANEFMKSSSDSQKGKIRSISFLNQFESTAHAQKIAEKRAEKIADYLIGIPCGLNIDITYWTEVE